MQAKHIVIVIVLLIIAIITLTLPEIPKGYHYQPEKEKETSKCKPELTIEQMKQRFLDKTLPAIKSAKDEFDGKYIYAYELSRLASLSTSQTLEIRAYQEEYDAETLEELLIKMRTHPTSIILAQAALESGWGTSRFYNEANNIFGIWSCDKDEPRIAAQESRGDKKIYIKRYESLEDSVKDYFLLIAKGPYRDFREARLEEFNAFKLIGNLQMYSELREEYVERLYYVLKKNSFYTYDTPKSTPLPLPEVLTKKGSKPAPNNSEVLWSDG